MPVICISLSEAIVSLLLGVVGSLVASLAYTLTLFRLATPKIEIGEKVALNNGEYRFKIINKCTWSKLYDVQANIFLVKYTIRKNGKRDVHLEGRDLVRSSTFFMEGFKEGNKSDSALHVSQFRSIDERLDKDLAIENQHIQLQIIVRHGITGFVRVFNKTFEKGDIIEGIFAFGNSCEITTPPKVN